MKKLVNSATCFLAFATATFVNIASAQTTQSNLRSPYGPYRHTGGWNVSAPQNQSSRPDADAKLSSVVQAAFYQSPSSGMPLPAYPGNDVNSQSNNYAGEGTFPPQLPSMPNALSGGQPGSIPGRLSDVELPRNLPPQNSPLQQNYQPNNQMVTPPPQQPAFDAYAREQQQVFPQTQSPYQNASTNLRAVQSDNQQNPAQYNPANNPGNDLRPVAPTMQRGFGPNTQRIEVASGYPFVSPAPRTGNYPTSQYQGFQSSALFRPVSYQTVVPSPQAPLSAAVANTQPTLPQFQNAPAPGVYPTQYQCAPGAPTYPAPGAVPGAYVPPTLTPNLTPGTYSPNNSGYSPVFSLGQENYNVQIGRGIIGQPTVYVPGQPFRNFIRYLSP